MSACGEADIRAILIPIFVSTVPMLFMVSAMLLLCPNYMKML